MLHILVKPREKPLMETTSTIASDLLYNIFTCDINKIYKEVLYAKSFMYAGLKTRQFISCNHTKEDKCLALMKSLCLESAMRVVKVIRLRLYDTRRLLDTLPSLKIIHLVRDPRGIMESRRVVTHRSNEHGKLVCENMAVDLFTAKVFSQLYPGRIVRVFYEDLAQDPIGKIEKIYNILGKRLPPKVRTWIEQSSLGHLVQKQRHFSTFRANSSLTAMKWRTTISWQLSHFMDQNCVEVYSELGYLPFSSEAHLRDLSKPYFRHLSHV